MKDYGMIKIKDNSELDMENLRLRNEILKKENDKLHASLDYVAMMTDVTLPEEDKENGTF